ncbi:hypothetical protein AcV7_005428 [Taiwanofungus camphoratus]|nr:hypothetical protein AcV7_005428 [Antrodia cinnamomea]
MNKITAERNQRALLELANQPGNDVCADCKARHPRWASHNLGIFICVNCASVHRKMGTHISKVKSATLDTWTKEQVECMRQMGNVKSNSIYNPDQTRHPPPTNMIDSERDSELEKYIRSKYEFKSFVDRSAQVAVRLGPSRSASSRLSPTPPARAQTVPVQPSTSIASSVSTSAPPVPPPKTPTVVSSSTTQSITSDMTTSPTSISHSQFRSASQPVSTSSSLSIQQQSFNPVQSQSQSLMQSNSVWDNLASLQSSSTTSSFSLQYTPSSAISSASSPQPVSMPGQTSTHLTVSNPYNGLSMSPGSPSPSSMNQGTMAFPAATNRSMSLNAGLTLNGGLDANTGSGQSINPGAVPTFEPRTGLSAPLMTPSSVPSPNPFMPQSLPVSNFGNGLGMGNIAIGQQQPSAPFGGPLFPQQNAGNPFGQPPTHQPSPLFQPQSLAPASMQMQMPTANPFLQSQPQVHTPFTLQPHYGMATPSPFGQPSQQPTPSPFEQPAQQPMFNPGNPFNGWQQGQQGGFPGQQWTGM